MIKGLFELTHCPSWVLNLIFLSCLRSGTSEIQGLRTLSNVRGADCRGPRPMLRKAVMQTLRNCVFVQNTPVLIDQKNWEARFALCLIFWLQNLGLGHEKTVVRSKHNPLPVENEVPFWLAMGGESSDPPYWHSRPTALTATIRKKSVQNCLFVQPGMVTNQISIYLGRNQQP